MKRLIKASRQFADVDTDETRKLRDALVAIGFRVTSWNTSRHSSHLEYEDGDLIIDVSIDGGLYEGHPVGVYYVVTVVESHANMYPKRPDSRVLLDVGTHDPDEVLSYVESYI